MGFGMCCRSSLLWCHLWSRYASRARRIRPKIRPIVRPVAAPDDRRDVLFACAVADLDCVDDAAAAVDDDAKDDLTVEENVVCDRIEDVV